MKGTSGASNFIDRWVSIRIDGFLPERLISEAMAQRIPLRKIRHYDGTRVFLVVAGCDLPKLRRLAKSRYRITVLQQGGVRVWFSRIRRGKLCAAGVLLFLLVVFAQSLFVREINVVGCRRISETVIRESLAEEGLYEGGLKKFDCDAIERKLFSEFDDIVWARVAYEGGYVEVQIAESRKVPADLKDRRTPCNLVAEQDCYIEAVEVYKGRKKASANDFVRKGDILIAGEVPIEHPTYPTEDENTVHYVHAEGKVTARVPYYFSFYLEDGQGEEDAMPLLRAWIKENVPDEAQILNKDFHFRLKKNIIKVYGTVETRQLVGTEKEIVIDKHSRRTEEDTDSR